MCLSCVKLRSRFSITDGPRLLCFVLTRVSSIAGKVGEYTGFGVTRGVVFISSVIILSVFLRSANFVVSGWCKRGLSRVGSWALYGTSSVQRFSVLYSVSG